MGVGPLLERGADFVLWALVDSIVDGYFPVFDAMGDEIDDVQDAAVERPTRSTLERVFRLKRELIRIRHVLAPSREVFAQLTSREFELISEPNTFYFRDVYDHLIRLNDELDSFRELVAGLARDLPVHDQQQPVDDHEAAHRGHRDPGGHRRSRRRVRDERGGVGPVRRRRAWVLHHPDVTTLAAALGVWFLRRINWL